MSGHPCESDSPSTAARQSEMIATGTLSDWLPLIRAEYLEIPDLRLTRAQFQRLWSLDNVTCDSLIQALVDEGFLKRTDAGSYVRA
jgi:hypothetical protein